jgi:Pyruvate/2-oxoglutarate dehydrogenase complex, dehydrogenase (E1) component, eukaryotic type, beta subunit
MNRTVLDSLNAGLLEALKQDETVLLLGEDILDPYGGAFKATRGCSTAFPDRVIATPISEAGLGGLSAGLALRGMRPVLEVMFGDFTTLLADQIINHISKFRWMYNNSVSLPLVIRTPMGGRRGYGPTHSQSLEKLFLGVPGLTVIAPLAYEEAAGELLQRLICETEDPVLFIENKLQYLLPLHSSAEQDELIQEKIYAADDSARLCPTYRISLKGAPAPQVSLAAYGYMAELARQAQLKLAYDYEIFTELIAPTRLAPFDLSVQIDSVRRTGRLLTLEEGTGTLGWGTEVAARVAEAVPGLTGLRRLSAQAIPVPASSTLEKAALPQVEDIIACVRKMV